MASDFSGYVCKKCGAVFSEPAQQSERENFDWLDGKPSRMAYRDICPFCWSDEIGEGCRCLYCGEGKLLEEMLTDEICRDCFTELSEQRKDFVKGFLSENAGDFAGYCAEKLREEVRD